MTNQIIDEKEVIKDLRKLGIEIKIDNLKVDIKKEGYKKISLEQLAMFDSVMKTIPTLLHHEATKEAYSVIFDKGLGVLQKASIEYPGYFRGNIVEFGTNNKIKGQALIKPLEKNFQLISATFTVMSIITGQYYLHNINKEMKNINKKLNEIQDFLSEDKKSILLSEEEFLNSTQDNLEFILSDNVYRSSTLVTIQKISIDSLAGLKFYCNQINQVKIDKEKDKIEEIIQKIKELGSLISNYLYSIYLFSFSLFLETILSQNTEEKYFDHMKDKIEKVCIEYQKNSAVWLKKWNELVKKSKAFSENIILKYLKTSNVPKTLIFGLWDIPITILAKNLSEKDIKSKKDSQSKVIKLLEKNFFKSIDLVKNNQKNIELYNAIYNKPVKILKQDGEMYIKIENPYEKMELIEIKN